MNPQRRQLLEEALDRHALDGLVAWRPEEIVMLSGRHPHWGLSVVLAARDETPILFVPDLEPENQPAGFDVRTFPWGTDAAAWDKLQREISTWAAGRRVGWKAACGHTSLPGNAAENPPWPADWPQGWPGQRCDEVVDELLAVKTPADLASIRATHRVAAQALATFRAAAQPGATEAEVAGEIEATVHRLTGKNGHASCRAWACVQSGPNTAHSGCFNRSTGRSLLAGDRVLLEIAVCVDGYWADLTESLICGGGPEARALLEPIRDAARAALATIRPGVPAGDVDRAARELLASCGLGDLFPHATGHPTGFRYHDSGPMLAAGSTQVLREGMVLTVEPGLYDKQEGARIEVNVVVTATGAEILGGGALQP